MDRKDPRVGHKPGMVRMAEDLMWSSPRFAVGYIEVMTTQVRKVTHLEVAKESVLFIWYTYILLFHKERLS